MRIIKYRNYKEFPDYTKCKVTSNDVLMSCKSILETHIENTDYSTCDAIVDSICNDNGFFEKASKLFGKKIETNLIKGAVNLYFINKHDVGEKLLHYGDYRVDTKGSSVTSQQASIHSFIAAQSERDAELVDQVFNTSSKYLVLNARLDALERRAQSLHYFAGAGYNNPAEQKKLKKSYIDFHLDKSKKPTNLDYYARLGKYYSDIQTITKSPDATLKFVSENFDLLVQPPQFDKVETRYRAPETVSDMAQATNIALTFERMNSSRNLYRKTLQDFTRTLPATPVVNTQEISKEVVLQFDKKLFL